MCTSSRPFENLDIKEGQEILKMIDMMKRSYEREL